jgi:hypothetical protein
LQPTDNYFIINDRLRFGGVMQMRIETQRLLIRDYTMDDVKDLHTKYLLNPSIA